MDDPTASRALVSRRPAVTCGMAVLLFLSTVSLYTLGGCLSPPPRPLFRPMPAGFAKLAQEIANFRGLPLKRAMTLGAVFNEHQFGDDFTPPIELNHLEQVYKSIALLTQDTDLARALDNFRRLNQFFSYDSARAIVNVAPAAAQIGTPFEITEPTLAREAPLGFALSQRSKSKIFTGRKNSARPFWKITGWLGARSPRATRCLRLSLAPRTQPI